MNQDESDTQSVNRALQDKGGSVLREFTRVVNAFSKALDQKDRQRESIKYKLEDLFDRIQNASQKLETVVRNIEIYRQNNEKIAVALDNLAEREELIKGQFEKLMAAPRFETDESAGDAGRQGGMSLRENLVRKRKQFLDGLDGIFRKLEEELAVIEGVRKEMERARMEIAIKNEESLETKLYLENQRIQLLQEVKVLQEELDGSVKQETVLIREFDRLLNGAEAQIEIGQEADRVLLSVLAEPEPDGPELAPARDSGPIPLVRDAKKSDRPPRGQKKAAS
ncbi:MAG: hypothetical protein HY580_03600 [Nitrospinae bacterium]|nr:hypothetical protein [Nitrospinota bacterium]